jgi:lysozyme
VETAIDQATRQAGQPYKPVRTLGLAGEALIKRYEGFRPYPYLCPANVPTIGYGSTVYPNGRKVSLADPKITESIADQLFHAVMVVYCDRLNALIKKPISQNQFDAICSLAYNIGTGAFAKSAVLRMVNAGKMTEACNAFMSWTKGGGKVLPGLVARRNAEMLLFNTLDLK